MRKGDKIELQQKFAVSANELWRALTEHDQMIEWYFENIPDFEPIVGFTTAFDVKSGDRVFPHVWTVTEVVQHEKIVYDWEYTGYEGKASLILEVEGDENQSALKLCHLVLNDFDSSIPEFKASSCQGGWDYFIKERLFTFLKE